MQKVGILYICTGKYDIFWKDFYLSSEKYLLNDIDEKGNKKFEKYYFVWTDTSKVYGENENKNIKRIYQENLGWPGNTLMRFDMFLSKKEELEQMDYLFFFNANSLFVSEIHEEEFLPNQGKERFVGALHPGFYNKPRNVYTYDNNKESLAFIDRTEGRYYFMGALIGGETKSFLEACEVMNTNTKKDLEKNIIARFHDESHWNRYLAGRDDIKILGPEYLYPENWKLKLDKEIKIKLRHKEYYIKSNLFAWKNNEGGVLKKIFINLKKMVGDLLKRSGLKKY